MGCQMKTIISFLPLLSLLFVFESSTTSLILVDAKEVGDSQQQQRRRRRLGGGQGEQKEETKEEENETGDNFYDLSLLTEDKKLEMVKMAYSLTQYGDSIDWDVQRDNFVQTVRESRSQSRSADANDDVYNGQMDDTLELFDTVIDGNDDALDGKFDDTLGGDIVVEWKSRSQNSVDGNAKGHVVSGSDDAYNGESDDTLDGEPTIVSTTNQHLATISMESQPHLQTSRQRRQLQKNNIDGDVFDQYEYSRGSCPNDGSLGVPCAPNNLSALCNKYDDRRGSFRACIDACTPAFCCIHDAPRQANFLAPNCNTDENCPQYNYCYIAWWKLHDTIGPALFLRVEQEDDFFDVDPAEIENDSTGDELLTQVLLHHFDDIQEVIDDGTLNNEFNADRIFLDEEYWVYPVAGKVDLND